MVDRRRLDGRKLTALKFRGLVEDDGDKVKSPTADGAP